MGSRPRKLSDRRPVSRSLTTRFRRLLWDGSCSAYRPLGSAYNSFGAQVEDGIGFGINLALNGGISLAEGGTIEHSYFRDYPALRMAEMPRHIDAHIAPYELAPSGLGEPGSVPIPAAVANAFARLTGKTARRLPLG